MATTSLPHRKPDAYGIAKPRAVNRVAADPNVGAAAWRASRGEMIYARRQGAWVEEEGTRTLLDPGIARQVIARVPWSALPQSTPWAGVHHAQVHESDLQSWPAADVGNIGSAGDVEVLTIATHPDTGAYCVWWQTGEDRDVAPYYLRISVYDAEGGHLATQVETISRGRWQLWRGYPGALGMTDAIYSLEPEGQETPPRADGLLALRIVKRSWASAGQMSERMIADGGAERVCPDSLCGDPVTGRMWLFINARWAAGDGPYPDYPGIYSSTDWMETDAGLGGSSQRLTFGLPADDPWSLHDGTSMGSSAVWDGWGPGGDAGPPRIVSIHEANPAHWPRAQGDPAEWIWRMELTGDGVHLAEAARGDGTLGGRRVWQVDSGDYGLIRYAGVTVDGILQATLA